MAKISINMKSGELEKQEIIVGIDLGTTHSLVAYTENGQTKIVRDESGRNTLVPSIVYLGANNSFIVGDEAKSKLVTEPERTIYSVKRLLGKTYGDLEEYRKQLAYDIIDEEDKIIKVRVDDHFFTPVELSAEILKHLKERVASQTGKIVSKAVVTVPAYFNDAQRQATRDAGKLAGLEVLRIINEPTAASLAYGLDSDEDDEIIAVYDLGGGTFDISILQLNEGVFEVLSTNGDSFLGGDDIDKMIVDHWIKTLEIDPKEWQGSQQLRQSLRITAERAKKALSSKEHYESEDGHFTLSRQTFEELITGLVDRTIDKCRDALKDADLGPGKIDKVVFVGGSTRIPLVKQKVKAFFEATIHDDLNPDEVVAMGAAIQADILAGNNADLLLLDVTPLSLGIETMGGLMDVIIPRNSKIPHAAARNYTTSIDGQRNLKIAVYQGERDLVEDNRKLGEFILKNIPPMPAGIPKIEVQFIIDADGILKVRARELRSETETEIQIQSHHGISEEEMARMLLDSLKHAEEDMQEKALREARNEALSVIRSTEKFIKQNQSWLDEQAKSKLNELASTLRKLTESGSKDELNKQMQVLNEYARPLAEKAMNEVVKSALSGKSLDQNSK